MAQLLSRDLDDDVTARLQQRAASHGRSIEEEARAILRAAADQAEEPPPAVGFGTRVAARFSGLGLTDAIDETHGQQAVPAAFDPG